MEIPKNLREVNEIDWNPLRVYTETAGNQYGIPQNFYGNLLEFEGNS